MSKIKVTELPNIVYSKVSDDDIMIIETKDDTYNIKVLDLKNVFSCDKKLQAISDNIEKKLSEFNDIIIENQEENNQKFENLESANNNLKNNLNDFSKRINTTEKDINILKQDVEELKSLQDRVKELESYKSRVESLEKDNEENKIDINNLKNETEKIAQIQESLTEMKDTINQNQSTSTNIIQEVDKRLDDKINRIQGELLDLIDSYHHETH